MQNAFEYADEQDANPSPGPPTPTEGQSSKLPSNDANGNITSSRRSTITEQPTTRPFLSLASFRMVVLADELLESFFSEDLTSAWHLEPLTEDIPAPKNTGLMTGRFTNFVSSLMTDENKEFLGKLADDIGKRLDIQQIEQKPALGRLTGAAALQEPQERATLLSTSKTSPMLPSSPFSAASMRQPIIAPSGITTSTSASTSTTPVPQISPSEELSSIHQDSTPAAINAAAEKHVLEQALPNAPKDQILGLGIMDERPRFAIDDAGDEDEGDEDGDGDVLGDDDSGLMNGEFWLLTVLMSITRKLMTSVHIVMILLTSTDVDAFLSSVDDPTGQSADSTDGKGESSMSGHIEEQRETLTCLPSVFSLRVAQASCKCCWRESFRLKLI